MDDFLEAGTENGDLIFACGGIAVVEGSFREGTCFWAS
jgi:hypothetical protein